MASDLTRALAGKDLRVLGPLLLAAYFLAPLFAAPLARLLSAAHPTTVSQLLG